MPNDNGGNQRADESQACFTQWDETPAGRIDGAMDTVYALRTEEDSEPKFFGFGHPPED
jgi:hypothetical protein